MSKPLCSTSTSPPKADVGDRTVTSALGSSIQPIGDRIRSLAAGSRRPPAAARPLFGMPQSSGRVDRTPLARGRLHNTEKPLALSLSDEGDRLYLAPPALRTSRIAEVAFQVRLP